MAGGVLRGVPDLEVIARTTDYQIPRTVLAADSAGWRQVHLSED